MDLFWRRSPRTRGGAGQGDPLDGSAAVSGPGRPGGWRRLEEPNAAEVWNRSLLTFADASPFQAFEMADHFRERGWRPAFFVHDHDRTSIDAMCLCLIRTYPGRVAFVWCVGGPVGEITAWRELPAAVVAAARLRATYFRFRCDRPRRVDDVLRLRRDGWTPAGHPLGPNLTMTIDPTREPEELLAHMAKNWRRNLRIARENDLRVRCDGPWDPEALRTAFAEMARAKGLDVSFPSTELGKLAKEHPDRCVVYTATDASGATVAFLCSLLIGPIAHDYYAATTPAGRELKASYLLFWTALCDFHRQGIASLDLGGIDPLENPGVYRFKRDTGAVAIEALGEWDWATRPVLKWAANAAIGLRCLMHRRRPPAGRRPSTDCH